jgi:hypothetical protein
MITGTASRAGATATAAVILVGAAILRGSTAAADPNQDDQFLALLDQRGIPALENPPSLIDLAHRVCGELDRGRPADGVVEAMTTYAANNDPRLTQMPRDRLTRTFSRFVTAAVQVYCPVYQDKVASISGVSASRTNEPTYRVVAYTHTTGEVRLPHSIVGGVEIVPAGDTVAPQPPQVPAPSPPPAEILIPPRAPVPPPPTQKPPPPRQQPPPPTQMPPPPEQEAPPPTEKPPPPQETPPQEPPAPQQVEPPSVVPQPGGAAGEGGIGGGGGPGSGGAPNSGGGGGGATGGRGPAEPSPTRPMPPGVIRIAP